MFIYQLTIDKEYHSFAFSLLPVARFLCLPFAGSERGLAAYLLGSGLDLLLLLFSVLFFTAWYSSLSWSRVSLIVVDDIVGVVNVGSRH